MSQSKNNIGLPPALGASRRERVVPLIYAPSLPVGVITYTVNDGGYFYHLRNRKTEVE